MDEISSARLSFNVNAVSSNARAQEARSWESYLYLGFKPAVVFNIPAWIMPGQFELQVQLGAHQ